MDLAAPVLPFDTLNPVGAPNTGGANTPASIRKAAEEFEAAFLSALLQPMFNGLSTEAPFGGGQGEAAFKSFMVEEMAKQAAKKGGVGLADHVARELMRMQGLTTPPAAAPAEAA